MKRVRPRNLEQATRGLDLNFFNAYYVCVYISQFCFKNCQYVIIDIIDITRLDHVSCQSGLRIDPWRSTNKKQAYNSPH